MYLSTLGITGFKSFADTAQISFGHGITALVGPNGCGKTNVVDAIRWVLGEQRPGALRSGRMEDVVFCGSPARRPLGMAEVSLTISDVQGALPVEYGEVTVTRRLFRSGESEYLLNKIPCRLIDITSLFMDTGVGAHAYSVIEQGMIDHIISDRTEDRRRVFEEAAGVTKYKARRKIAFSKLSSVQQDVARIGDLIGEVERQVTSLRRQAGRATRYKTYADEAERISISLGILRFTEFMREAAPISRQIDDLNQASAARAVRMFEMEALCESSRVDVLEKEHRLAALGDALSDLTRRIHEKDQAITAARERVSAIEAQVQRSATDEQDVERRLLSSRRQLESATEEECRLKAGMEQLAATISEKEARHLRIEEETGNRRRSLEADRQRLMESLRDHATQAKAMERSRTELSGVKERAEALSREVVDLGHQVEESRSLQGEIALRLEETGKELLSIDETLERVSAGIAGTGRELAEHKTQRERILVAKSATEAKLELWERMAAGYQGYSEGVRRLLLDSPYRHRLGGSLADIISTDRRYEKAIEAALEDSLESVVADGLVTAKEAIRFLKEGRHGRVRFIPMDSLRGGNGRARPPSGGGVVGCAMDLVSCEERYCSAVQALLDHTLVVENLDIALSLSGDSDEKWSRFVTLDGDVIDSSGCLIGGERGERGDPTDTLVGRKRNIAVQRGELEEKKVKCAALDSEILRLDSVMTRLAKERDDLSRRHRTLADMRTRAQQDILGGEKAIRRLDERRHACEAELSGLTERSARLSADLSDGLKLLDKMEADRERLETLLQGREQELDGVDKVRSESSRELEKMRIEAASLRQKREGLLDDKKRLSAAVGGHSERLASLREDAVTAANRLDAIRRQQSADESESDQLHRNRLEIEKERAQEAGTHQEQTAALRASEDEIRSLGKEQEAQRKSIHELSLKHAELVARADALRERMLADHRLDPAGRQPDTVSLPPAVLESRLQQVQDQMRAMGPVNLAASEEYEEQRSRYEFLTKERDDLLQAEQHLKETIERIDGTARKRFLESFEQIREQFKRLFVEFFDGGDADVVLGPGDDPLESEIQVVARPRGKRLQTIHLLSGGERALTAIALLLSIYLIKPSPFCILDEVDAPLDDENLSRFLRVMRRFSEKTQFIVVTHNKRTMQAGDSLCGVTMEEVGVSKVVAVRMPQADGPSRN